MHLGQGGLDKPSGKRRSQEEASGNEDGGADERGEEGAVDGLPPGTRLGKERPMPWTVEENNIKYFPKHTIYLYLFKNNLIILCVSFRNKVGRRKLYTYVTFLKL